MKNEKIRIERFIQESFIYFVCLLTGVSVFAQTDHVLYHVVSRNESLQIQIEVLSLSPLIVEDFIQESIVVTLPNYTGRPTTVEDFSIQVWDIYWKPMDQGDFTAQLNTDANTLTIFGHQVSFIRVIVPGLNDWVDSNGTYNGEPVRQAFGVVGIMFDPFGWVEDRVDDVISVGQDSWNWVSDQLNKGKDELGKILTANLAASTAKAIDDVRRVSNLPTVTIGTNKTFPDQSNFYDDNIDRISELGLIDIQKGLYEANCRPTKKEAEIEMHCWTDAATGFAWVGHAFKAEGSTARNAELLIGGNYKGKSVGNSVIVVDPAPFIPNVGSGSVRMVVDFYDCTVPEKLFERAIEVDISAGLPDSKIIEGDYSFLIPFIIQPDHRYLVRARIESLVTSFVLDYSEIDFGDNIDNEAGDYGLFYKPVQVLFASQTPTLPPDTLIWSDNFDDANIVDWTTVSTTDASITLDQDDVPTDYSIRIHSPYEDYEGATVTGPSVGIYHTPAGGGIAEPYEIEFDFKYDDDTTGLHGVHWFYLLSYRQVQLIIDKVSLPLRYYDDMGVLRDIGTKNFIDYCPPGAWRHFKIKVYLNRYDVYVNNSDIGGAARVRLTGDEGFHFLDPYVRPAPCEYDYINRGYYDNCIIRQTIADYDGNGIRDDCELSCSGDCSSVPGCGQGVDENNNQIPDQFDCDCDASGIPDFNDISASKSPDVNMNNLPDECEPDCNGNTIPDLWELQQNPNLPDCNGNGIPDSCELINGAPQVNGQLLDCLDNDNDSTMNMCDSNDDNDIIYDSFDNCPFADNPLQEDMDRDGIGDVCDNCLRVYNPDQADDDRDEDGDCCDPNDSRPDFDEDGVIDLCDVCPVVPDPNQLDTDHDGIGQACDKCLYVHDTNQTDFDNDGVGDVCDNCQNDENGLQTDTDQDGVGDSCDNCPSIKSPNQNDTDADGLGDCCDSDMPDSDSDGINDLCDICPNDDNPDQLDTDQDGVGNACEVCKYYPDQPDSDFDGIGDLCECLLADISGDYLINLTDLAMLSSKWLQSDSNWGLLENINADSQVNVEDFRQLSEHWLETCNP